MLLYLDKIPKNIDKAEFEAEVRSICKDSRIKIVNPNWLMLCMWAESDLTLITNGIGAYGFIQITTRTAEMDLGIFMADLKKLDWKGYMEYVRQYLLNRVKQKGVPATAYELYALIHFPVAFRKTDDYILYVQGSDAYKGNKGLDFDKDGKVKWAEVKKFLDNKCPTFYDKTQLLKAEDTTMSYYTQTYNWTEIIISFILVLAALLIGWWWIPNQIFINLKQNLKNGILRTRVAKGASIQA